MPRETKLQRLERENADMAETIRRAEQTRSRDLDERRRLEDRCTHLYETAMRHAADRAREHLDDLLNAEPRNPNAWAMTPGQPGESIR